jgi:hypothetical protein
MPLANTLKNPANNVRIEVFLIRFSIITPTLLSVVYSLRQFTNDRRLYEKYAFKAISTYSAEASVATLARAVEVLQDKDKDKKIVDFAVNTFTSIYQEPVEPVRDKWVLKGGNKLLALTAEVNDSVGEIKKDVDKLADNLPGSS